jgi:D-alanyl-D-alanine carboxypeptidase
MVLGSGTKSYTAAAIMQLVDQGKIDLEDKANKHADGPMKQLCNNTMEDYFGPRANNVTIHNLLWMESGLIDFEDPQFDSDLLHKQANQKHLPCHLFEHVRDMPEKDLCGASYNCTWLFEPGTNTSYSSTNYELAGFVLLGHAPEGKNTFDDFDLIDSLGLDKTIYKNSYAPSHGVLKDVGLGAPGWSLSWLYAEIWE